jgi:hypothetical protein
MQSGLTPARIVSLLHRVEDEYPVAEWTIGGTRVWPLIRIDVAVRMRHQIELGVVPSAVIKTRSTAGILAAWLRDASKEDLPVGPRDVIMFGISARKVRTERGYYSPYTDPIVQAMREKGAKVLAAERDKRNDLPFPRAYPSMYLNYSLIRPARRILRRYVRMCGSAKHLPGFEEVASAIEEIGGPTARPSPGRALELYQMVKVYKLLYSALLRVARPRVAVVHCFYSFDSFAIVWACKEQGIPCFDYQHGVQGRFHYAYCDWRRIPLNGYELLPDGFLVWDDQSAENILRWAPRGMRVGKIGNLWHARSESMRDEFATAIAKLKRQAGGRAIALFTLQEHVPAKWVLEAIKGSAEVFWLARLHPGHREIRSPFMRGLSGAENVDIELASTLPLPALLEITSVHVTGNSSVVLEAGMLGVRSIVLDKIGLEYYRELIDEGTVAHAGSPAELRAQVKTFVTAGASASRISANAGTVEPLSFMLDS